MAEDRPVGMSQEGGDDVDEALLNDPFIAETLGGLSSVDAPVGFLPNVMAQVYQVHHREKVHIPTAVAAGVILFLITAGLFLWDVADFARQQQLDGFGAALSQKFAGSMQAYDELLSAFTGMVSASIQLVLGSLGLFFNHTPVLIQLLILAGLAALIYGLRRLLIGARG